MLNATPRKYIRSNEIHLNSFRKRDDGFVLKKAVESIRRLRNNHVFPESHLIAVSKINLSQPEVAGRLDTLSRKSEHDTALLIVTEESRCIKEKNKTKRRTSET